MECGQDDYRLVGQLASKDSVGHARAIECVQMREANENIHVRELEVRRPDEASLQYPQLSAE